MVAHSRFTYPEEACGLLAGPGDGRVTMAYCLTNRDRSPYRFTVDPTEHFRAIKHAERCGWEIIGVFHSHPQSDAHPSAVDVSNALDPNWLYVVVGLADERRPDVRSFRIVDGTVAEATAAA